MSDSRREFFRRAAVAVMAGTAACRKVAEKESAAVLPPGAPPAFGTAPEVGPVVSKGTFAEAEKLVQFELTPAEREMAAGNWRKSLAPIYERRMGPRKFAPAANVAPATRWNPMLPGMQAVPARDRFVRSEGA